MAELAEDATVAADSSLLLGAGGGTLTSEAVDEEDDEEGGPRGVEAEDDDGPATGRLGEDEDGPAGGSGEPKKGEGIREALFGVGAEARMRSSSCKEINPSWLYFEIFFFPFVFGSHPNIPPPRKNSTDILTSCSRRGISVRRWHLNPVHGRRPRPGHPWGPIIQGISHEISIRGVGPRIVWSDKKRKNVIRHFSFFEHSGI